MKIDRVAVHGKYDGRCAYCGRKITLKEMHVDHVIAKRRYSEKHECLIVDGSKFTDYGLNDFENLNPSCKVCNPWKSTHTVEEFRHEIEMQIARLRMHSASFRMAERYNLVSTTDKAVIFYFEGIATNVPLEQYARA